MGNNAKIGIRGFTTWKQKASNNQMLPPMRIEPRPLIKFWFQVQHCPLWTNLAFAWKTEILGYLFSHSLLIQTKSSKYKIKWCMNPSLEVAHARFIPKGLLNMESEVQGFNTHWG